MLFKNFAEHLERLEKISSRLAITDEVVRLLKKLSTEEVAGAIYILMGRLEPTIPALNLTSVGRCSLGPSANFPLRKRKSVGGLQRKGDVGEVMMDLPPRCLPIKTVGKRGLRATTLDC